MPLLGSRGAASSRGFGSFANLAYFLTNSLRFRGSNSAFLSRTPASTSNQRTFTWSGWVKRGILGSSEAQFIFSARSANSDSGWFSFFFNTNDTLCVGGWSQNYRITSQLFRDPSAWYHLVLAVDTTQATASNRVRVYVNGSEVTAFSTTNNPSQNFDYPVNSSAAAHSHGSVIGYASTYNFDGYMDEVNFVDGQALTASSFGKTDAATGQWVPKKFGGAYGTNGFYLNFNDSSAVGKDSSGNGNNWSTSGHSVTPGATYDLMTDVPTLTNATTANYATWNPLWKLGGSGYIVPTNGNLRASSPGNNIIASTIPLPSTGKWYMEFRLTTGVYPLYGLCNSSATGGGSANNLYGSYYNNNNNYMADGPNGLSDGNNANTTGDIGLIAVDVDNNKLWIGRIRSGTTVWMGGGNPSNGTNPSFSAASGGGVYATTFNAQTFNNPFVGSGGSSDVWDANFGQQPWTGTLPTGFKALNTYNLP